MFKKCKCKCKQIKNKDNKKRLSIKQKIEEIIQRDKNLHKQETNDYR